MDDRQGKLVRHDPLYRGKVIELGLETVDLPNGTRAALEIVRHPGGAAVVAINGSGEVCLLRQYRHAAGGWLWELPAGKIDDQELPLETARRELAEEAGLEAARWESLGEMVSSPGVFTEVVHLYLARSLSPAPLEHEPEEVIELHWLPYPTALEWVYSSRIKDGKSALALLRAAEHLRAG